ncbi:MAG: N-acetyltransferase [Alphaproteobacteria bacterium]|nr:N-acetyltransferase [Alphaproteobacteria bacterium]MBU1515727.1 N-acetyltransferase [Alphaproteobacteria bacterium]MBU2097010.1 N-acetyltransferase [Alphaproteobacteria bacterium]MBU2149526.1 N-acetyltransferase [Alphaproteobacteria bacterium]MBU2308912.1 N-acetyltransferase [Alphaproteobacteria bacterium]
MSLQPNRPPPELLLVNEAPAHAVEIEALLHRAFGPGRFAKVSERVREFADFAPELSFCAIEAGKVVGVVRMWRVAVGDQPVMFLGPLAVEESERRHGLGAQLVERACQASQDAGEAAVLLVGDLPYFQRTGFAIAPDVTLPGPVDARRVLARTVGDMALSGPVKAR